MVSTAALQSNCTGLTVHTDHRCEWERELTYLTLVNCPGSDPRPPGVTTRSKTKIFLLDSYIDNLHLFNHRCERESGPS